MTLTWTLFLSLSAAAIVLTVSAIFFSFVEEYVAARVAQVAGLAAFLGVLVFMVLATVA